MDQRSVFPGQAGRAGRNRLLATKPPHSDWLRGIAANLARLPGLSGGFLFVGTERPVRIQQYIHSAARLQRVIRVPDKADFW